MSKRKPIQITAGHIAGYQRHVVMNAPHECWGWKAWRDVHGYGNVTIHINGKSKTAKAHRISYYIAHGSLPKGADILHLCHNPACSNPNHLRAGTRSENMLTSFHCGRLQRRIPLEDMPHILQRRVAGHTLQTIANDYRCTKQAVRHMIKVHGHRF